MKTLIGHLAPTGAGKEDGGPAEIGGGSVIYSLQIKVVLTSDNLRLSSQNPIGF